MAAVTAARVQDALYKLNTLVAALEDIVHDAAQDGMFKTEVEVGLTIPYIVNQRDMLGDIVDRLTATEESDDCF